MTCGGRITRTEGRDLDMSDADLLQLRLQP